MAHEVFDVSRIDEDGLEVLDDDEVELEAPAPVAGRGRARSEAPHPPRPSVRPRPLAPDDVRLEPTLSYASNPAAVLLDVPVSQPPARRSASGRGRTAVLILSAALLALVAGAVLARHSGPRARPPADAAR